MLDIIISVLGLFILPLALIAWFVVSLVMFLRCPKEETEKDIPVKEPIDLQALLPQDQTSFHYNGSLTTPPCTEEVKWMIFEQPIEMSNVQIQAFQDIFPANHRPVQSLNEREIIKN